MIMEPNLLDFWQFLFEDYFKINIAFIVDIFSAWTSLINNFRVNKTQFAKWKKSYFHFDYN